MKYFNCLMSLHLHYSDPFKKIQINVNHDFFADTCTRRIPIFKSREE
jgi:hypothetical protein